MKSRAAVSTSTCRVCTNPYNPGDEITYIGYWAHVDCTEDDENGVRVRKPVAPASPGDTA